MNLILFLAKRFSSSEQNNQKLSRPVIRFSLASVTLSVTVIIISLSVLLGFKRSIVEKMVGFSSPVQIVPYDGNTSMETRPMLWSELQRILPPAASIGAKQYAPYAIRAGIISSDQGIQGVVLKGVSAQYDFSYLSACLRKGRLPKLGTELSSNEVLISESLARQMRFKIGDSFSMFFVQDPPRQRRFKISGLYATQMKELDMVYVIGDIRHAQKLNGWTSDQITGLEVRLKTMSEQPKALNALYRTVMYKTQSSGCSLRVEAVQEKNPQLFDWLALQDTNAWVIMCLMMAVAGFSMITGLLILLLERTSTIGLLKAMGMKDRSIQAVFLVQALRIAGIGLAAGNVLGIGLCLLQKYFSWIRLDPENYYLDAVPIALDPFYLLLINLLAFVVIALTLWLPSLYIGKIRPASTLRFE